MKMVMFKSGGGGLRSGTIRTRLSPIQSMIVLALLGSPYMGRLELSEVVWPDPDAMPDVWANTLRQHVSLLNKKMTLHGQRVVSRGTLSRLVELAPERMAA